MSEAPPEWHYPYIAALVDNHAGIVVTVAKRSEAKIGYGVQIECRIKLQSAASKDLLTAFCETNDIAYRVDSERDTTYESYQVVISRRKSVKAFLECLLPYLVVREEAITRLCETIIPKLEQGAHREKRSFLALMHDIEEFREEVGRANRTKYDLAFFREEWDVEPGDTD